MKNILMRAEDLLYSDEFISLKNSKILSRDRLLIRGKEFKLLPNDYYLLLAAIYTDKFENIDSDYVVSLRHSIREDINHSNGLLEALEQKGKSFSKKDIDLFLEAYNQYFELDVDLNRRAEWHNKYLDLLK